MCAQAVSDPDGVRGGVVLRGRGRGGRVNFTHFGVDIYSATATIYIEGASPGETPTMRPYSLQALTSGRERGITRACVWH